MQQIAFFRNVNQGQQGHPSTYDLLAVVSAAGATEAFAFRSNGTVVFDGEVDDAAIQGDRDVFIRPVSFIERFLRFEGSADEGRLELTLFDPHLELGCSDALEAASQRGRCEIVESGAGWALVLNHVDRQSNGTPVVERVTGGAATSRALSTVIALARKLDV